VANDCDDTDAGVRPDAAEVCNGLDDDCDAQVDDEDATVEVSTGTRFFADADGDGFGDGGTPILACALPTNAAENDLDCNDGDAATYPGSRERCGAGDEDCDGLTDDDDPDRVAGDGLPTWIDVDGDGFGDPASQAYFCVVPADRVTLGRDCDDAALGVHPSAREACNGWDDDCDGRTDDADAEVDLSTGTVFYRDADEDGYGDAGATKRACEVPLGFVANRRDCDDADGAISPDARDVCGDGVDQDCSGADRKCGALSGTIDLETDVADLLYVDARLGTYGAWVGALDWNGDGQPDLGVADTNDLVNRTSISLYLGPIATGKNDESKGRSVLLTGGTSHGQTANRLLPLGDLDGDGNEDVYVTSTTSTYSGPVLGDSLTGTSSVVSARLFSSNCASAGGLGDQDGDGTEEWVCIHGLGRLFEGTKTTSTGTMTDDRSRGGSSFNVGGNAGDVDGDGLDDLWLGASTYSGTKSSQGAAYLFYGPVSSSTATAADATIDGTSAYQDLGSALATGDLDGSGALDVVVSASGDTTGGTSAGAVFGFEDLGSGSTTASSADFRIFGEAAGDRLGQSVLVDDMDGDGIDDLVISSHLNDGDGSERGAVWLLYGPLAGTLDLEDAPTLGAYISGVRDDDRLGGSVVMVEDLFGRGGRHLVVGAHAAGEGTGTYDSGVVYFLSLD